MGARKMTQSIVARWNFVRVTLRSRRIMGCLTQPLTFRILSAARGTISTPRCSLWGRLRQRWSTTSKWQIYLSSSVSWLDYLQPNPDCGSSFPASARSRPRKEVSKPAKQRACKWPKSNSKKTHCGRIWRRVRKKEATPYLPCLGMTRARKVAT